MGAQEEKRHYQILVIDDNAADARLLQEAWKQCNIAPSSVATLQDSRDAIRYLRGVAPYIRTAVPDLIFLDYKLPVDGGIALTEIKGDPDYIHIPIIVLTGSIDPHDYLDAYQRHANCCFHKPTDYDDLSSLICEVAKMFLLRAVLPRR